MRYLRFMSERAIMHVAFGRVRRRIALLQTKQRAMNGFPTTNGKMGNEPSSFNFRCGGRQSV